jgi:hypothetical protein
MTRRFWESYHSLEFAAVSKNPSAHGRLGKHDLKKELTSNENYAIPESSRIDNTVKIKTQMKSTMEEIDNQEEECAILENSKIDDIMKIKNQRIMESKIESKKF